MMMTNDFIYIYIYIMQDAIRQKSSNMQKYNQEEVISIKEKAPHNLSVQIQNEVPFLHWKAPICTDASTAARASVTNFFLFRFPNRPETVRNGPKQAPNRSDLGQNKCQKKKVKKFVKKHRFDISKFAEKTLNSSQTLSFSPSPLSL